MRRERENESERKDLEERTMAAVPLSQSASPFSSCLATTEARRPRRCARASMTMTFSNMAVGAERDGSVSMPPGQEKNGAIRKRRLLSHALFFPRPFRIIERAHGRQSVQ